MRAGGGRSHFELVVHAPAASNPDFVTLLALDGVLAGGKSPGREPARQGTRLHRALVESRLATSVTTEVELSEYPALYSIGVDAGRDADLAAIEKRLDAVLGDAMTGISEGEVARAVRQVRADYAFGASSNRAVANMLTVYEQMGSVALLASIPQRLNAVNAEAVRAFARERLAPDRRSIGLLVPDPSRAPATLEAGSGAASRQDAPPPSVAADVRRSSRPMPSPKLETPELPAPVVRRLGNGVVVLAVRVPGESTHMRIRIAAGSKLDPPGREGTALLVARMLAEENTRALRALDERDVRLAVSAVDDDTPFTMRNMVEMSANLLPDDLAVVTKAIVPAITTPGFQADDVERMKASIAGGLASQQDDSRWRANHALFDNLYDPSTILGRAAEGTVESRRRITPADLSAFHAACYRPERTVVAIAGPRDPAAAIDQVAGVLGGWRPSSAPLAVDEQTLSGKAGYPPPVSAPPAAARRPSEPRIIHVPLEKAQASIAVGLPGVARSDPDFAALAALNYLLGETGYAGRLGERLVDTGLAYAVYASVLADRDAGPIMVTTDAVRAREAVARIVATLDEFAKQGITDAELREAKGFLLGRLLFRFESAASATAALADLGYFGDESSPQSFARRVLGLTPTTVSAAARRYYDPSRAVIVVAGRW